MQTPTTALIVDEDLARVAFLSTRLEYEADFKVVGFATTGSDGVELADRAQPLLVISDYDLPDVDGTTLVHRLRQVAPDAAIVLYTANWSRGREREARLCGADLCVEKSMTPTAFIESLRSAVSRRAAVATTA